MLKKLYEYDLSWLMKNMIYFYIALIFCAVLSLISGRVYHAHLTSIGWVIVDKICSNLFISACFCAFITITIRVFVRFRNNFFKDESYLTHTLPVSKQALFAAKVLAGFTAMLITILVIFAGIAISLTSVKEFDWFKGLFTGTNVLLGIVLLEEMLLLMLCLYAGTVIGNRSAKQKTLVGVLMGLLIYFVVAQFVGIGLVISFFADSSVRLLFRENPSYQDATQALKLVSAVCTVTYGIGCAAVYLLTNKLFAKGVNVD